MPVYLMCDQMPHDELQNWLLYFERRPQGWREDLRTAYIMNAFGDKRKPQQIFESLAKVTTADSKSKTAMGTLKNSAMFSKMLSATGGDKLEILGKL